MSMKFSTIPITLFIFFMCSHAMSGVASYENPSTWDLLFRYDDLKSYLQARRAELQYLNKKLTDLDDNVLEKIGKLRRAQKELKQQQQITGTSNENRQKAIDELEALQRQADNSFTQIMAAKGQQEKLQDQSIAYESQVEKDQNEINELKQDVTQLEKEVVVLDKAVDRTLKLKNEQILRQE